MSDAEKLEQLQAAIYPYCESNEAFFLVCAILERDYAEAKKAIAEFEQWREQKHYDRTRACPCVTGCKKCGQKGWVRV